MRRTICGLLVIAAMGVLAASAGAETWTVSIQGGATVPTGDFGSQDKANAETGWSMGAAADYNWNTYWSFGIDGSWNQNANGAEGSTTDLGGGTTLTIDEASYSTWQIGTHARYFFPTTNANMPVRWFGIIGGGLYGFTGDMTETTTSGTGTTSTTYELSDKRAGMKLGLGGLWWANPQVGMNFGVDYNIAFFDKDYSPSATLDYMGAYVGVTFNIPSSTK